MVVPWYSDLSGVNEVNECQERKQSILIAYLITIGRESWVPTPAGTIQIDVSSSLDVQQPHVIIAVAVGVRCERLRLRVHITYASH